jgi:hypothetical protein
VPIIRCGTADGSCGGKAERPRFFSGSSNRHWRSGNVQLDNVRSEIKRLRTQVGKQRREILDLQRAGIPSASAEILLQRMLDKIDGFCAERDKLKAAQKHPMKGKVLGGRQW